MFGFGSKKDKIDTKQVLANIKEKIESREKAASSFQDRIEMDQVETNDYNNSDSFKIFSEQVRKMYEKQTAGHREADAQEIDPQNHNQQSTIATAQDADQSNTIEQEITTTADFNRPIAQPDAEANGLITDTENTGDSGLTEASSSAIATDHNELASLDNILDSLQVKPEPNLDATPAGQSSLDSKITQQSVDLRSNNPTTSLDRSQSINSLNISPMANSKFSNPLESASVDQQASEDSIQSFNNSEALHTDHLETELELQASATAAGELSRASTVDSLASNLATNYSANSNHSLESLETNTTPGTQDSLDEAKELSAAAEEPNSKIDGLGIMTAISSEDSIHQLVNTETTMDDFLDSRTELDNEVQSNSAQSTLMTQEDLAENFSDTASASPIGNQEDEELASESTQLSKLSSTNAIATAENSADTELMPTKLASNSTSMLSQHSTSHASNSVSPKETAENLADDVSYFGADAASVNSTSNSPATTNATLESISENLNSDATAETIHTEVSTPNSVKDGLGSIKFTSHSLVTATPMAAATQATAYTKQTSANSSSEDQINSDSLTEIHSNSDASSSNTSNNISTNSNPNESGHSDALLTENSVALNSSHSIATDFATEENSDAKSTTIASDNSTDEGENIAESNRTTPDDSANEELASSFESVAENSASQPTELTTTEPTNSDQFASGMATSTDTNTFPVDPSNSNSATNAIQHSASSETTVRDQEQINNLDKHSTPDQTTQQLTSRASDSPTASVATPLTEAAKLAENLPSANLATNSTEINNHHFNKNKHIEATMNSHHKVAANLDNLIDKTAEQKVERAFAKLVEVGNMDSVLNRYLVKQVPIMINEWLDENLPILVTKYVKEMAPEFLSKQIRRTAPSLLTKWLNGNLPEMVEQLVAEEIQRISDQVMKKD